MMLVRAMLGSPYLLPLPTRAPSTTKPVTLVNYTICYQIDPLLTLPLGYVPPSFGHYVENIGNTTLKFLEIFNSNLYEDISLNQWLALTPPDMVKVRTYLIISFLSANISLPGSPATRRRHHLEAAEGQAARGWT
jgi:hypothetical protein